jgi:hypothetical protein
MDESPQQADWRRWLEEHAPKFLLFARQQARSEADAQDLVQEALVEACHWLNDDRPPPPGDRPGSTGGSPGWARTGRSGTLRLLGSIPAWKPVDEARKAMQDALRSSSNAAWAPAVKALKEIQRSGPFSEGGSSVTVRSTGQRVKSIVKADESGTLVLVCNPKPHLTAHDKGGKLVFDGEIDTPE